MSSRTLETLIRTRTNREFLGISGFTPWYFIWQASNGKIGEEPSFLDREVVATDMERLLLYYNSLGFRGAEVDTTIINYKKNNYEVSFLISEGPPSVVTSVSYANMPEFDDPGILTGFLRRNTLSGKPINDTTFAVNRRFNTQELRTEQLRIIDFLKNNGYASVQRDSVTALVRPNPEDTTRLDIRFRINPGRTYQFGDVHVSLADGNPPDEYTLRDTLNYEPYSSDYTKAIYRSLEPAAKTKISLLSDQIHFKPGDLYNHSLYLNTIREFQNLGMLFIRRFGQSEESTVPDFSDRYIPTYIEMQTLTRHSFKAELFGMKRYGYGTGFGVDYTNNNVFGKAESFSLSANSSFEFVSKSTLASIADTTSQSSIFRSYEIRGDYTVPRLNFPFSLLDNTRFFERALTRYSLSYSRSDQLYFDINSDVRFNLRYEVQHTPRYTSYFDLLELDLVDASPTDEFRRNLNNEFGVTEDDPKPIELLRILEDFEPQVSSTIRYTFRSLNTDLIKRNHGYFSEYSISSSGNIPFLLDRFVITPGTVEGELPALLNLSNNTLAYSQFIKLTADYRRYYSLSPSSVFAWRLFGGFAQPYGKSRTIPLNQRFFAGGSNDIRGWAPFQLGPGSLSGTSVTVNGGEIKLAAFTELRQTFLRNVLKADWQIAWFNDAGNVWYGPRNTNARSAGRFKPDEFYKQIAMSSGLGLRFDWNYVVLRIDFAYRIHDLDLGWFNNKKRYFSFGIGHSF